MINLDSELKDLKIVEFDLLIIGAGGTGLRAAISASETNISIGIVTKSLLGKAHTVMAEGGVAASFGNVDTNDNWEVHFRDTYKGGGFHNNWVLAEILVKEAPQRIIELEKWGAVFDRTPEGKIKQRNFGGHTYPRLAHVGDRTGLEIIRTLEDAVIHKENVEICMETTISRLLTVDDQIVGAMGYHRVSGQMILFKTKAIILASGGSGKIFSITSNSWEGTGDGFSLAYEAGAELVDMEFVQFHPTGMAYPSSVRGILVTEGVRGEGGILLNSEKQRFMFNYIPEKYKEQYAETPEEADRWWDGDKTARKPPELLTRDVVAAAIISEVKAGRGSEHGAAYLDIGNIRSAEDIKRVLPSMYHQMKTLAKIDITKEPIEVAPTAHHNMGGVRFNVETNESNLRGLYAAGEVSGGVHGGTRLGGNALADILVFGARVGSFASKYVKDVPGFVDIPSEMIAETLKFILAPFSDENDENPYALHKELQVLMSYHFNSPSKKKLEDGLERLGVLKRRIDKSQARGSRKYNPSWHMSLDLQHMYNVAKIMLTASMHRNESRASHSRADFPDVDPELRYLAYIISKGENGDVVVTVENMDQISEALQGVLDKLDN